MAKRSTKKRVGDSDWTIATAQPVGTLCGEPGCGEAQRHSPGGATCVNGHGGVDGVEPRHQSDCPVPHGASADCSPPGWCAVVDAARKHGRSAAQLAAELSVAYPRLEPVDVREAVGELADAGFQAACSPSCQETTASFPAVRFVAVPTTPLVQFDDQESGGPVEGAIVKVSPTLRASERASFDAAGLAKGLRKRGALAVLVAPKVLPDSAKRGEDAEVVRQTTRESAADWFGRLRGGAEADREAALALVEQAIDEDERERGGDVEEQ